MPYAFKGGSEGGAAGHMSKILGAAVCRPGSLDKHNALTIDLSHLGASPKLGRYNEQPIHSFTPFGHRAPHAPLSPIRSPCVGRRL
jgi:hypothetical protein